MSELDTGEAALLSRLLEIIAHEGLVDLSVLAPDAVLA